MFKKNSNTTTNTQILNHATQILIIQRLFLLLSLPSKCNLWFMLIASHSVVPLINPNPNQHVLYHGKFITNFIWLCKKIMKQMLLYQREQEVIIVTDSWWKIEFPVPSLKVIGHHSDIDETSVCHIWILMDSTLPTSPFSFSFFAFLFHVSQL